MKVVKILKWLTLGVVLFFILSIVISSLFSGKVRFVDQVRLFAQRPAIRWLGTLKVDELPISVTSDTLPGIDISYEELLPFLKKIPPGSIFLTRTRNYAISEFIPGMWKHAGIFLGTKEQLENKFGKRSKLYGMLDTLMVDNEIYVLDSEAYGVRVHPFIDMSNLKEKSYLTNFTAFSINTTKELKLQFLEDALKYLEREYDYDWLTEDDNTLYCSELIYHSLKTIGVEIKKRTETLSRIVITPDDLFEFMNQRGKNIGGFILKVNIHKEGGEVITLY